MSEQTKTGISRRTVVKGAAWAVPAVTLATATPAFAATYPSGCGVLQVAWTEAEYSGQNAKWGFKLRFTNTTTQKLQITSIKLVDANGNNQLDKNYSTDVNAGASKDWTWGKDELQINKSLTNPNRFSYWSNGEVSTAGDILCMSCGPRTVLFNLLTAGWRWEITYNYDKQTTPVCKETFTTLRPTCYTISAGCKGTKPASCPTGNTTCV